MGDIGMDMEPLDDEKAEKTQFGVQSVEIGLKVLSILSEAYQPLMLKDLAKAVGMPAAKVHRYLVSLARSGMVEQNVSGGRYGLGPLALKVGLAALNQLDVIKIAGAGVAELRDRTDHSALLAIWGSAGPTIVRLEECRWPATVNVRVGSVLGLTDSASGLIFAAFLPRHLTEQQIGREIGDRSRNEIEDLLSDVRARGMSRVHGNQLASINAMSAPVFDHANNVAAALTILGPERRFSVEWDSRPALELKAVARQVSERLGFLGRS